MAEAPGHLEVLQGRWYTGTLGCPCGLLNERVSCPKREDPGLFWGCREPGSGLRRPPTWGKDIVWEKQTSLGLICMSLTKPWDSEGTQADLPWGSRDKYGNVTPVRQETREKEEKKQASAPEQSRPSPGAAETMHGKCDPSQTGNERKRRKRLPSALRRVWEVPLPSCVTEAGHSLFASLAVSIFKLSEVDKIPDNLWG